MRVSAAEAVLTAILERKPVQVTGGRWKRHGGGWALPWDASSRLSANLNGSN